MKVSVLQFKPHLLDRDYNLGKIVDMLGNLQTDVVVLPELATSGYVFDSQDDLLPIAEEAGLGLSFQVLGKMATKGNYSIVYGFPEYDRGRLYNSAALINPNGDFFVYRKAHLFLKEKLWFKPGDSGFWVYEGKNGVKLGLMICFDWQFPEACRTLALKGAQIICHPSNLVLPWCQQSMKVRSLENRVFSITANRVGSEGEGENALKFTGASQILDTKGNLLCALGPNEEGIVSCEIDPQLALDKSITDMNDAFGDRKQEYYQL